MKSTILDNVSSLSRLLLYISIIQLSNPARGQEISPAKDIKEISNIYYHTPIESDDTLRLLNLVLPETTVDPPLLIWVGGGAWSYVDRNEEMHLARRLAGQGIAVASIGHRLSSAIWRDSSLTGGHQHPDHINDLAEAVKWLSDHAAEYGYDHTKLFVGGFSSGAQLAALLLSDLSYLKDVNLDPAHIKGVIPISGTYDIQNYYEVFKNGSRPELARLHVESVFGDSANFVMASPANLIEHLKTPMLLMSDANMYNYTKLYEEKLVAHDFQDLDVLYIRHLGHAELWRNLSFEENSIYRNYLIAFIKQHASDAS